MENEKFQRRFLRDFLEHWRRAADKLRNDLISAYRTNATEDDDVFPGPVRPTQPLPPPPPLPTKKQPMIVFKEATQHTFRSPEDPCYSVEEDRHFRGMLGVDRSGAWTFCPERQSYSAEDLEAIVAKLKELNP